MINVTKTFLPPKEEYEAILNRAWDAGWITNRGLLVKELEEKLKSYLEVPNLLATTNGTLPIQIALKALGISGEVITTPFSYVATTSCIVWEGCTPVFVDIHPEFLTIDESRIEDAITEKTSAILATHVFGNPCNVEAIEEIAVRHGLKVIYDAAHAFGVNYKGTSLFNYGDVSTCSFHATKVFHTGEGGAIICSDPDLMKTIFYHHNFGHDGQERYFGLGINAKMSELQAAMGLAMMPYMNDIFAERKRVVDYYNAYLTSENIQKLRIREGTDWNSSYYPIILESEENLNQLLLGLKEQDIYPRRYFYPGLNSMPYLTEESMKVSDSISSRILCLPLYDSLSTEELETIAKIVNQTLC